ncbi:preprotein translocase subunit SecA [Candidatus Peregrinibacteria bacterium CG10_big_fil_rev_8_21_14_0_10_49_24]|nr:MAG: preprotein translocase subunit SecA [Candidatus Peregrinibacteria bacterium CG11_big_fil_rev_8_21_14_0_20_49_14]PIR50504.1 MAG: preprotein translocase subunit SecA [Candidatus Peregrinibacteria bacterium CG10_big_fil_rev_8_21_14_0_10_49_24]PJA67688.1 MAG: preprotein translocase subunit SecA [Candidatus Peregrinibacteria bacterium CG_4_9_14_3_um_filter_49_12]
MTFIDFLNKLLGDPNEKELKKLRPIVSAVRSQQQTPAIQDITLSTLPAKTEEFRLRLEGGETTDDLLPEAFATVIRACELLQGKTMTMGKQEFTWNMIPFDVQIIGGAALHKGSICEMKTGEGKTLVCTMPVYLNAISQKGVHVVTVNDYLAKRDALWMGMLYEALGLTVGTILHEVEGEDRRAQYACDITYGTNNEFGFDYLRDNMAPSLERRVQRPLHYAIVDEVDSILIDEARTPLIISQPAGESTEKYGEYARLALSLQENVHYNKDEKQRVATLTEEGVKKMEELLNVENIYVDQGFETVHHIEQALRAHAIYQRDVDYVVKDGEIIIVDEFTGRLMPGRRYSHGLHQALEAKEKVEVQRESKTLATITFQNYFRLYEKLAGMTGTAKTEEEEFLSIYKLPTIVIPTHRLVVREDKQDAIYKTILAKFTAVAKVAKEKNAKGQPVLIGTTSIEKSEALSELLKREQVPHQVLNAKHHQQEAEIVAGAGQKGAVTIATNMAGRGTDIKLGEGVAEVGGLCILGTERHEARRIDNQLRGRSGRQGDPGESQFFVSMEDDIMRLFGGDRIKSMMERLKVPDDVPLETSLVSRSIESAQKRVEGRNFDIRKHVVQYDDVMNKHREIIYKRREHILQKLAEQNGEEESDLGPLHGEIIKALTTEAESIVTMHASSIDPEEWDAREICEIAAALHPAFGKVITEEKMATVRSPEELGTILSDLFTSFYEEKCAREDSQSVVQAERIVTLRSIDTHWMDHIDDMAHLREQVSFAGYAQRDPLIEYKDQGFRRFRQLLAAIDSTIIRTLLQADFRQFVPSAFIRQAEEELEEMRTNQDQIAGELESTGVGESESAHSNPVVMRAAGMSPSGGQPLSQQKVGRNDPCPCGSGKKFKKCHGA